MLNNTIKLIKLALLIFIFFGSSLCYLQKNRILSFSSLSKIKVAHLNVYCRRIFTVSVALRSSQITLWPCQYLQLTETEAKITCILGMDIEPIRQQFFACFWSVVKSHCCHVQP